MAQYKNQSDQRDWIHELAQAELHPDAEKLLHLGKSIDPQQIVEESCVGFLTKLRTSFGEACKLFNSYSQGGKRFGEVKIYQIARTPADFMLFREGVKLVVSNTAQGVIQISFARHVRGEMAINGQTQIGSDQPTSPTLGQTQELVAQLGPFREVDWTFQGKKVEPKQLAKFYFSEFVRATRSHCVQGAGSEVLLEQIKTLLKQKGLDI